MFQHQTLIVDDEKPAVELLLAYAAKIPELKVVGTAHSAIAIEPFQSCW